MEQNYVLDIKNGDRSIRIVAPNKVEFDAICANHSHYIEAIKK